MGTYTQFGAPAGFPSTPFQELPPLVQLAILDSGDGTSNDAGDEVIGSAATGLGWCARPENRQQIYCACVNAPVGAPECIFAPCANHTDRYTGAYRTSTMAARMKEGAAKACPKSIDCTQVVNIGGSSNIATGITQSQNCGGVVNKFITNIQAHPVIAIVALILILSVIMLSSGSSTSASKTPPSTLPPLPAQFGTA